MFFHNDPHNNNYSFENIPDNENFFSYDLPETFQALIEDCGFDYYGRLTVASFCYDYRPIEYRNFVANKSNYNPLDFIIFEKSFSFRESRESSFCDCKIKRYCPHDHAHSDSLKNRVVNQSLNGWRIYVGTSAVELFNRASVGPFYFKRRDPKIYKSYHTPYVFPAKPKEYIPEPINSIPDPQRPHWIQARYTNSDGTPITNLKYTINYDNSIITHGYLNSNGETKRLDDLKPGTATITFGDKVNLEKELQSYRDKLKSNLDFILIQAKV